MTPPGTARGSDSLGLKRSNGIFYNPIINFPFEYEPGGLTGALISRSSPTKKEGKTNFKEVNLVCRK